MEQLDQNNGGPDGVAGKMADTVNKLAGGGDSHQNVTNIVNSSVKMNTNNSLIMGNHITTSVNKNLKNETFNECAKFKY